jgi:putative component of toxin-antitoxin plasmid stabilization module
MPSGTARWWSSIGSSRWGRRRACRCRRSLGDGLFELRFTLGPTARRITYRFTKDGRIILLTTFRKQRNNERNEITRARKAAEDCAEQYP